MTGAEDLMALLKLVTDPAAAKARLDEQIDMQVLSAGEQDRAAEMMRAAQARTADLDRREAALRDQELAAHVERQKLVGIRQELVAFAKALREQEDQVKSRILKHAGWLEGLSIQSLPSWQTIDAELTGARPADYQHDDDSVGAVAAPQPVEHASPSTLTRTRRAMRRGEATA
jgi:hypothetical protein